VSRGRAQYDHEDTGVSFECTYAGGGPGGDVPRPWAVFGLDLPRPSFFAEEATREVGAFAGAFGDAVLREGESAPRAYDVGEFLKAWEAATRTACAQVRAHAAPGDPPFAMPRERLLTSWQWNYGRQALQQQEGDTFVPRVWYIRTPSGAGTCVIWPEGVAVRVPQADCVIFHREELAPRTRLGRRPDIAVAPWSLIAGAITGPAFYDHQLANWRVTDERVLRGLMGLVVRLRGTTDMPEFLPPAAVVDAEYVAPPVRVR
jgi:hypothetical protein